MTANDNNTINVTEQKDFWDNLQLDIYSSEKLTREDYYTFIERNFMFSLFYRGCLSLEIASFQKLFQIKDYAYVILFEILGQGNLTFTTSSIDELKLHSMIKNYLHDKNCAVGPIVTNRLCILISSETLKTDQEQKEESANLSIELIGLINDNFNIELKAGIGQMLSIHSIYTSYLDSLACLYFDAPHHIAHYLDLAHLSLNNSLDYLETEKRLLEAIRLRKAEAYDYFGIIMEIIKPLSDNAKRNKMFELLVLANQAMNIDSQAEVKYINYTNYVKQFLELKGNELTEFAFKCFIYITSYVKPQTTIDYTNHIVKATKEYLENHYADDISLEDMASQVNISPQYFSKLIKKNTGFNYIDWLSMFRVKKAKELLTDSSLTVKEVCFMVGYKDPNYFSRIFKKRMGITPSEYVKASTYLNNKS